MSYGIEVVESVIGCIDYDIKEVVLTSCLIIGIMFSGTALVLLKLNL
jgi:hypothetical protein